MPEQITASCQGQEREGMQRKRKRREKKGKAQGGAGKERKGIIGVPRT
jgi:hypothetical protein